jgi:hypothetical protein
MVQLAARMAVVLLLIGGLLATSAAAAGASSRGIGAVAAAPAVASAQLAKTTASCGGGRCTVYLSKAETRAMANGWAPALPTWVDYRLKIAYTALVVAHRWFALQYANRGWCSGFRLSIDPWESQGYFGYAC